MSLFRLTIKSIRSNVVRFLLTGLAVVLGVGFVVGTFIITDGLRSTFGDLKVPASARDVNLASGIVLHKKYESREASS